MTTTFGKTKSFLWKILSLLSVAALLTVTMTACGGSNEPCETCGRTPTTGYDNKSTGEVEYYCASCSSDCEFCSEKATKNYTSGLGVIVFVCDECYNDILEMNS